jgi:hypothetical protein
VKFPSARLVCCPGFGLLGAWYAMFADIVVRVAFL